MPTVTEETADDAEVEQVEQDEQLSTDSDVTTELPPTIYNIRPIEGALCNITIETSADPSLIGYPIGNEFSFTIGDNDTAVAELLENNVCLMTSGQSRTIDIKVPDDDGQSPSSEDQNWVVTVTLNSFQNISCIHNLSKEEKFEIAKHHKSKGVDLFKDGLYEFAFSRFSKSLKYLIVMLPKHELPEQLGEMFDQVRIQCYSNMAACQIKSNQYDFVIANCTKALNIDPVNVKCLFRRAEAYFQSKKLEQCRSDVMSGLKIEPKSRSLQQLLQKL